MTLRLGTRRSPLARWQADWVTQLLQQQGHEVEQILITTQGDARSGPIGNIGGQGVFTKEIQRALLEDEIDLAVHSLKDLPTEVVDGLALAAIPERESMGDALISGDGRRFVDLPEGCTIGTGSLRRRAQLLHLRPDLDIRDIRGNVDSRLKKLDNGEYQAIVLAEAGLIRLGLNSRITQVFDRQDLLPAVGQGALGIEARKDDQTTCAALAPLNHDETRAAALAERRMLATLRGGCLAPIGAWGRIEQARLLLTGVVLSHDGATRLIESQTAAPAEAESLGQAVAEALIEQGADKLLER